MAESRKVAVLIRVSTAMQAGDDRVSIPAQEAEAKAIATREGLEIACTIKVADVSGTVAAQCPEYQQLFQIMYRADCHSVIAREFSRLVRPEDPSDYFILGHFVKSKTILYLPDGKYNFAIPHDRLLGVIHGEIANMELQQMRHKIFQAKETARRRGIPSSKIVLPFATGFDRTTKTHQGRGWFYTEKSAAVRTAFDRVLAGQTAYTLLAPILGIRAKNVRYVLSNPIYSGWYVVTERRNPDLTAKRSTATKPQADRPKMLRKPEDVIRVRVLDPPLVSEAEFARVQAIIAAKHEQDRRDREQVHANTLTYQGFLRCDLCGKRLRACTTGRRCRRRYYVCRGRKIETGQTRACTAGYIRNEVLEARLDDLLARKLTSRPFLEGLYRAIRRREKEADGAGEMKRIEATISTLSKQRERILLSFEKGFRSEADLDRMLPPIDAELARAKNDFERSRPVRTPLSVQEMAAIFAPCLAWKGLPIEKRRRILSSLVTDFRIATEPELRITGVTLVHPALAGVFAEDGQARVASSFQTPYVLGAMRVAVIDNRNQECFSFPGTRASCEDCRLAIRNTLGSYGLMLEGRFGNRAKSGPNLRSKLLKGRGNPVRLRERYERLAGKETVALDLAVECSPQFLLPRRKRGA